MKQLVEAYLADAEGRISKGCLRNYRLYLSTFAEAFPKASAEAISSDDAESSARKPEWSMTYRAGYFGCLSTLYRLGIRKRLLKVNPLSGMRKPIRQSRGTDAIVPSVDHERLLASADDMMADFLRLLWMTGARPGEIASLTVEMVNRMTGFTLPLKEHKGSAKGKSRCLTLNAEAIGILRKRADGRTGLLFPGSKGQRMSSKSIGSRMRVICKRAGGESDRLRLPAYLRHRCFVQRDIRCHGSGSLGTFGNGNASQALFAPNPSIGGYAERIAEGQGITGSNFSERSTTDHHAHLQVFSLLFRARLKGENVFENGGKEVASRSRKFVREM